MADTHRSLPAPRAEGLLDRFGSPLFVVDAEALRASYRTLREALEEHYPDARVHYAAKANYTLGVLAVLRAAGCGVEAYARCELTAARKAGFAPEDVLVTGMNRRQADIERALEWGVDRLLVDNAAELDRVRAAVRATDTRARVLLRCNPALSIPTRPEIATATRESKFGLDIGSGRAIAVADRVVDADRLDLVGLQLHLGSQLTSPEPYGTATRELLAFAARLRERHGVAIDTLDMGGGFPVAYDEPVPDPVDIVGRLGDAIRAACAEHDLPEPTLLLEPGRRIAGPAGTLLATVGAVKETPHATFAVLDAGTNVLPTRWPYPIRAFAEGPERSYDVVGPLCYSGDVLREGVTLPELSVGDAVAIERVGAYSIGDASRINAHPVPAAVMLDGDDATVLRERGTCADLLARDRLPAELGGAADADG